MTRPFPGYAEGMEQRTEHLGVGPRPTERIPVGERPTEQVPIGERPTEQVPVDDRPPVVIRVDRRHGIVGVLALVVLLGAAFFLVRGCALPSAPFAKQTIDRSQPALLKSIQDLSRFEAASGNFQVIVDLQQTRSLIPPVLLGQRTLFVAAGSVDAYVDFRALKGDAITVSADRKSVTVRLPAAQLDKPNIDNKNTYVFAEQRGLINRLADLFGGDVNSQQQLYVLGEQKIADAAKASGLAARAQQNTKTMLTGMLTSLGFTSVTVNVTGA